MNIVRSKIFERYPGLVFGMSTAGEAPFAMNMSFNVGDDPLHVAENRKKFFSTLGIDGDRVAFPLQEHTNVVQIGTVPAHHPHCDALVTNVRNTFLAISIADCTPVMLYDPEKNVVAGIHAGWRGTSTKIVGNAIRMMINQYTVDPANIIAFIGPSAGGCCYEVGKEVAELFPLECTTEKGSGKYFLDVKKANCLQLLANGVQESHIEVHPDCSIHNQQYHSYRRDGMNSGRMLAIIGIK